MRSKFELRIEARLKDELIYLGVILSKQQLKKTANAIWTLVEAELNDREESRDRAKWMSRSADD